MKKSFILVAFGFMLVGCGANNSTESSEQIRSNSTESSTVISTTHSTAEEIILSATTPNYDLENGTFTIYGRFMPKSVVKIFDGQEEKEDVSTTDGGSYQYTGKLPAEDTTYRVTADTQNISVFVLSEKNAQKQKADEEQAKKDEEDKHATEQDAQESNSEESAPSLETLDTSDYQDEITSPTEEQKKILITWTQMDCENQGAELSFRGYSTWNVAVNYIDGKNRWISTTEDKKYGRIKSIYEWTGEEEEEATLIYLLINGNELLNNLN